MLKKICLVFIMLLIISVAFASDPGSATSSGGYGGTEVDSFMGTTGWSGMTFDKAFIAGVYSKDSFNAGFAKRFGKIYMGIWYSGNPIEVTTSTQKKVETLFSGSDAVTKTTETPLDKKEFKFNHNAQVLVGFPLAGNLNMGIKAGVIADNGAGVSSSLIDNEKNTGAIEKINTGKTDTVTSAYSNNTWITPSVSLAVSGLAVAGNPITPYATVKFGLYPGASKSFVTSASRAWTAAGVLSVDKNTKNTIKELKMKPDVTVGVSFSLPKKNEIGQSLGVEYNFSYLFGTYETTQIETDSIAKTSVTTIYKGGIAREASANLSDYTNTVMVNGLSLSYGASTNLTSNISTGISCNLSTKYTQDKRNTAWSSTKTTSAGVTKVESSGVTTTVDTIAVTPKVSGGFGFRFAEDKANFNVGIALTPTVATYKITSIDANPGYDKGLKTTAPDGTVTYGTPAQKTESDNRDLTFSGVETTIGMGFNYKATEKLLLDAGLSVGKIDSIQSLLNATLKVAISYKL